MGNGATTEFNFNFPYFENSNIIVTKNGATATGYSITGTSAGENADIPYTGGKVVFETAPTALDSITIARSLPLTRIVDYQPLTKINSDTLNKDANYLMEVIKDRKDEIESLIAQYTEIADKESTTTLLARITELHNEIVALGNIATLRTDVTTNTGDITTLKDAGNFTTTGKAAITKMGFPTTSYIDISVPNIGTEGTYTALADGYVVMAFDCAPNKYYWLVNSHVGFLGVHAYGSANGTARHRIWIPISKNQEARFNIEQGTYDYVRFYYANGSL